MCFHPQSGLKNPEHLKFLHVSSMHHIWRCMKGPAITWGQHRLGQTGKGCLGMWPWASGTPVESIFQERPHHHRLAMAELSGQLFLFLSLS
jgi:hypothetical protein